MKVESGAEQGQDVEVVRNGAEQRLEIPRGLTPELVETLCLLDDAPPGVAEATIALLPYGSRSNLAAHGIIGAIPTDKSQAGEIEITPYGWAVMTACAERYAGCGDTEDHPAVTAGGGESLEARWRAKAEAADRELSRMKAHAREQVEAGIDKLRSHPHTGH